jgi:DNA-binding NarL/FixJ family response regulator
MNTKILIIDDSAVFLSYISSIIETNFDVEITKIKDSTHALSTAKKLKPDIILTDLEMPNINGLALLREIKQTPELQSVPVIILTASDSSKNLLSAIELGAFDYLQKDLNALIITSKIKNLIHYQKLLDHQHKEEQIKLLNQYIELSNHEFNNALFISNGNLGKLKKNDSFPEDCIKALGKVLEMNARMEALVKRLDNLKNIKIEDFEKEIEFLKINY